MTSPDVWVHGASAGDLRAVRPFVKALQQARLTVMLSATTGTGCTMARQLYPHLLTVRAPLLPGQARFAVRRYRPRLAVFEYLELWPGWIAALHRQGIPSLVIDGRVSARSLAARPLLRRAASRVTRFCAQTQTDAENALALGFETVEVHGNGKHDGAQVRPVVPETLRAAVGPRHWIIGSLHPDEEDAALYALANARGRALIAPRYPVDQTQRVLAKAARLGVTAGRRSEGAAQAQWAVLDTMGELAAAYGLGTVAVIGGTFGGRQGQNLVEAAAWNRPILHGPNIANVRVEAECLAGRGAFQVETWQAAFACTEPFGEHVDTAAALGELAGANVLNVRAALALLAAQ